MPKAVNQVTLKFLSRSANESFARYTAAAFLVQLDPTLEEVNDVKTAVSEAVTNCIVHAYREQLGEIVMRITLYENNVAEIVVRDKGCGIPDIAKAREPMYTTGGSERSGMGFTIMENFMDDCRVISQVGKGTTVYLKKKIAFRYNGGRGL